MTDPNAGVDDVDGDPVRIRRRVFIGLVEWQRPLVTAVETPRRRGLHRVDLNALVGFEMGNARVRGQGGGRRRAQAQADPGQGMAPVVNHLALVLVGEQRRQAGDLGPGLTGGAPGGAEDLRREADQILVGAADPGGERRVGGGADDRRQGLDGGDLRRGAQHGQGGGIQGQGQAGQVGGARRFRRGRAGQGGAQRIGLPGQGGLPGLTLRRGQPVEVRGGDPQVDPRPDPVLRGQLVGKGRGVGAEGRLRRPGRRRRERLEGIKVRRIGRGVGVGRRRGRGAGGGGRQQQQGREQGESGGPEGRAPTGRPGGHDGYPAHSASGGRVAARHRAPRPRSPRAVGAVSADGPRV